MVTRLDQEQLERNAAGLAACRAVVAGAKARRAQPDDEPRPMTRSEQIHAAALAEAARRREALNRLRRPLTKEQQP